MAPTIRTHTTTRRGNRAGYQEHDDFEGLPVRQWRQEWVNISPPPPVETTQKNDIWAIELPHGMPKDSNLLPTHTLELLRAARSGRLYKRPAPAEEEEADADAAPEKPEKKEEDPSTKGYMVKMWKQIPRNAEGPTISHLAKRRKGTVTLSSSLPAGNTSGPTVTKATVRRIDAAGNPYNQTVILTEGQPVDGEIISTTVVQAPIANAGADNAGTPVRRRPPPPKRKAKGPGRGRKKKLPLPLPGPSVPQAGIPGAPVGEGGAQPGGTIDGIKQEGVDDNKRQDSEMADDDDDEEGDDDGDEGEDGDEGDEEDGEIGDSEKGTPARKEGSIDQEIKHSPSVDPPVISAPAVDPDAMDISTDELGSASPSTQPSIDLAPTQPPAHLTSPTFEGSPLKNVLIPSPTEVKAPGLPPISATSAPDTPTLDTPALESSTQETSAQETFAHETFAHETSAHETFAQEASAQETSTPEASALNTSAPEISVPEASAPDTSALETLVPETPALNTSTVETPVPETSVPEASAPEVSAPETSGLEVSSLESTVQESIQETTVQEPSAVEILPPSLDTPALDTPAIDIPTLVTPALDTSTAETSTPGLLSSLPSNPIPTAVPSVEVPQVSSSEILAEETAIVDPQVDVDTEMTDSAPVEPEATIESTVLPTTSMELDEALVEEVMEKPEMPLVEEPSLSPGPPVIEEATSAPSEELPQITPEATKAPSPVIEEPINPVQEAERPTPVAQPEQSLPSPVVEITQVEELSTAPQTEVPATVDEEVPAIPALQTEPLAPALVVDEREPESPDLLGGLEAALDRHNEAKPEEQIDSTPAVALSTDVPKAEPVPEPVPAATNPEEKHEETVE